MKCTAAQHHYFFFNDTATTEIYTLSLHDALPICSRRSRSRARPSTRSPGRRRRRVPSRVPSGSRSEEHTSELQSRGHLVCRLLLEKKIPNCDLNSISLKKNRQFI